MENVNNLHMVNGLVEENKQLTSAANLWRLTTNGWQFRGEKERNTKPANKFKHIVNFLPTNQTPGEQLNQGIFECSPQASV